MKNGVVLPDSTFSFYVNQDDAGERLDKYLNKQFSHYSRSFLQKLIENGHVRINDHITTKGSTLLKYADHITIYFPKQAPVEPQEILSHMPGVKIIYEHEHFLIVYKPANVLVHAPSKQKKEISLVDWITLHYQEISTVGAVDRPGIVHRLDKDTSGLIIIPRTNYAHMIFGTLFKERLIKKTYLALVHGHTPDQGTIEFPIGRHPTLRTKMAADTYVNMPFKRSVLRPLNPRPAITQYRALEYLDHATLVEVHPITGRTHQIRVHLAAIGHPIIGDQVYGTRSTLINRQALHAYKLDFTFDNKNYSFEQKVPEDFQHAYTLLLQNKKS